MASLPLDTALEEPPQEMEQVVATQMQQEVTEQYESDLDGDEDYDEDEDDPDFEHDRNENDQRLKGRFEHIFEKYAQDFTGVGDEIDIETGEIVVDNGHLANMRHEGDSGKDVPSQLMRAFEENGLDADTGLESSGNSESSEESDESGDDDVDSDEAGSASGNTSNGDFSARERDAESNTPPFTEDEYPLDPLLAELTTAANSTSNAALTVSGVPRTDELHPGSDQAVRSNETPASEEVASKSSASFNVLDMPAVRESMLALKSMTKDGQSMDHDAIQALGKSIATQLAQFVGVGGKKNSKSRPKKKRDADPTWSFPELPADKRRRTTQPVRRPQLPQLSSAISPGRGNDWSTQESIWAPVSHPKPRSKRDRAAGPERAPHAMHKKAPSRLLEGEDASAQLQDELQGTTDDMPKLRSCYNCGICATTAWRRGPEGDLCNACGMYLYRYGLMKPPRPTTPDQETEEEEEDYRDDSHYSANTSRRVAASGPRHSRFTVEEDALIIMLKEIDRLSWEKIGRHFDGRSSYAVQCRYSKKLSGLPSEGRDALIAQGFSFDKSKGETREGAFTVQDDEFLVQLRQEDQLDWTVIAERLPGQTADSLGERYDLLMGIYPEPEPAVVQQIPKRKKWTDRERPKHHNHPFSQEEDELLTKLREFNKLSWEAVAQQLPGRSGLALQKRYVRELQRRKDIVARGGGDPYAHVFSAEEPSTADLGPDKREQRRLKDKFVQHSSLTLAEEALLLRLKDEGDLEWEEISNRIPGRSSQQLQNRYYTIKAKNDYASSVAAALESSNVYDIPASDGLDHEPRGLPTHPMSNFRRGRYTEAEDRLIIKLKDEQDLTWEQIALNLPGRTVSGLESRWKKKLKHDRLFQYEESETDDADADGASIAADESIMQDDSVESIDPSLDRTSLPNDPFLPRELQGVGSNGNANEAERATGTGDTSYSPTEDGSEISHDPYQHFVPPRDLAAASSSLPWQHSTRILQPARPGSRYSQQEHDMIVNLRVHQRMGWTDIAEQLPGRSSSSIQHYYSIHIAPKKSDRNSPSAPAAAKKVEKTLLRQALDNRRRPEGAMPTDSRPSGIVPASVTAMGGMLTFGTPSASTVLGGGAPPMNLFHSLLHRSPSRPTGTNPSPACESTQPGAHAEIGTPTPLPPPTLLPSALPTTPRTPQFIEPARQPALFPSATPTIPHTPQFIQPPRDPASLTSAPPTMPRTPIFIEPPSKPRLLTSAPSTLPGTPKFIKPPAAAIQAAAVASSAAEPRADTPDEPFHHGGSQSTVEDDEDRSAEDSFDAAPVYPETPLRPVYGGRSDFENTSLQSTPFNGAPAAIMTYHTPARYNQQSMPYFIAPTANMFSPLVPQPDAGQDPAQPAVDRSLDEDIRSPQQKAAMSRATRVSTSAVELTQPLNEETVVTSDEETYSIPAYLRSPPGASLGSDKPPPFSWNDLITMALKSTPEQRLMTRGIYKYLENKFPYFKVCGEGWKDVLRKHLDMSSEFESTGSSFAATWSFARKEPTILAPKKRGPRGPYKPRKKPDAAPVHADDPVDKQLPEPPSEPSTNSEAEVVRTDESVNTQPLERPDAPVEVSEVSRQTGGTPRETPAIMPPPKRSPRGPYKPRKKPDAAPVYVDDAVSQRPSEGPSGTSTQPDAEAFHVDNSVGQQLPEPPGAPVEVSEVPLQIQETPRGTPAIMPPPKKGRRGPRGPYKPRKKPDAETLHVDNSVGQQLSEPPGAPVEVSEVPLQTQGTPLETPALMLPPKRGPGRPRKKPQAETVHVGGPSTSAEVNGVPGQTSAFIQVNPAGMPPQKRGRGRPRKRLDNDVAHAESAAQGPLSESYKELSIQRPANVELMPSGTAPSVQLISSDIYRDPESSPATIRARQKIEELKKFLGEQCESDTESDAAGQLNSEGERSAQHAPAVLQPPFAMPQTSSPVFARSTKLPSPPNVYGRAATPGNAATLLFSRLKQQGSSVSRHGSMSPAMDLSQSRSASRAGSVRRSLPVPLRVGDESEDELAL